MVCLIGHGLSIYETPKPACTMTHFLQDHTYSNKSTSPNSAIPFEGHFLSKYHRYHLHVCSHLMDIVRFHLYLNVLISSVIVTL
ncbi:hypothetical protein LEMLEM_LOCUS21220 [Lemmus lemmus]